MGIDGRMLGFTGIGQYIETLLGSIAAIPLQFKISVLCSKKFPSVGQLDKSFEFSQASAPIYSLREQWEVLRFARGKTLLHCPHYNIPYFYRGPLVVTIHDLTHLAFREFLPNRFAYLYARGMLGAAVRHASKVITVSEYSKHAIQKNFGIPEHKIRVIYNALADLVPGEEASAKKMSLSHLGIHSPYLLFVGNLKPHKNLQGLLCAFSLISEEIPRPLQLVIVGKKGKGYPALAALTEQRSLSDKVVFADYVPDEVLRGLYHQALALVLPSFNEGFGLPLLEAMVRGVPVAASKCSSLPEIVGSAGLLFDPHDVRDMAQALKKLILDEEVRARCTTVGLQRAEQFTARKFALAHLQVYREVLESL